MPYQRSPTKGSRESVIPRQNSRKPRTSTRPEFLGQSAPVQRRHCQGQRGQPIPDPAFVRLRAKKRAPRATSAPQVASSARTSAYRRASSLGHCCCCSPPSHRHTRWCRRAIPASACPTRSGWLAPPAWPPRLVGPRADRPPAPPPEFPPAVDTSPASPCPCPPVPLLPPAPQRHRRRTYPATEGRGDVPGRGRRELRALPELAPQLAPRAQCISPAAIPLAFHERRSTPRAYSANCDVDSDFEFQKSFKQWSGGPRQWSICLKQCLFVGHCEDRLLALVKALSLLIAVSLFDAD